MMHPRLKVVDIEISQPLVDITELAGYQAIKGIVRWYGVPVGFVQVPVTVDRCLAAAIRRVVLADLPGKLAYTLLRHHLSLGLPLAEALWRPPALPVLAVNGPLVTVAVCTRDRPDSLRACLIALLALDYPQVELLVVDNAPSDEATAQLVQQQFPTVRYVREPRPGLDWARNRAIAAATGEIIAYTDDDVVVDSGWVTALVRPFLADPSVMAVTGLVVPYEIETKAQLLYEEKYGGFSRGFRRRWCRVNPWNGREWEYRGTGQFGTGANMAYRRQLFDLIGPFDPALDVGTVTNGGGDLEMFYRVLKEGYTLVYEPAAMVRHGHRRDYNKLHDQITNNGIGLYAFWVRSGWAYPEERRNIWRVGIWWFGWWFLRRLLLSFWRPQTFPRSLIWTEIRGAFVGLTRYQRARRRAQELSGKQLPLSPERPERQLPPDVKWGGETAVHFLDISQPIQPLTGEIEQYNQVRLYVMWQEHLLGHVDFFNSYRPVSVPHLCDVIADGLTPRLLDPKQTQKEKAVWEAWYTQVRHYLEGPLIETPVLPETTAVSIILATFDRPDGLQQCLHDLHQLRVTHPLEIIVVDNHPVSGLTPPVVAHFPEVKLVSEPRQGLAYARNAGIRVAKGHIIVMTDDDVIPPPDWLEKLITPFARQDVMAVTGNVLPAELETGPQRLFEAYGGLGRGFERREVDEAWFEKFRLRAVPTWTLGATANAAFRATIFQHPDIGLMDEALGPGLPSGVGEDTYLFYKILKAGYTIVYEPSAYLQHTHRRTDEALRRQLYNYSKGHVAYHLTTWLRDGDWRGFIQLLVWVPIGHAWRIFNRLLGFSYYPLDLLWLEMRGNMAGPLALLRSHLRVRRQRIRHKKI